MCLLREVEVPQESFKLFLISLAQQLGEAAVVQPLAEAHFTVMRATPVHQELDKRNYTTVARRSLALRMRAHLAERRARAPMLAVINPQEPLKWMGLGDVLTLNVMPSDEMLDERKGAESFLKAELGVEDLPELLNEFDPHITVGRVYLSRIPEEARQYPQALWGRNIRKLGAVMLSAMPSLPAGIHQGRGLVAA